MARSVLAPVLAVLLVACRRDAPDPRGPLHTAATPATATPADARPEDAGVMPVADEGRTSRLTSSFCTEGFEPLDAADDACVLLPSPRDDAPRVLLVYLHGIVPPEGDSPQKTNVLRIVRSVATREGLVALVPRGRRGIGPKGAKDWYAWPTSPSDHAKLAREIVARWVEARRALEARVGGSFARTYLAGSSNGAYFLTALALRGDLHAYGFDVDGLGAMSGGSTSGIAPARDVPRPPFYVGWGAHDPSTKKGAKALASRLVEAGWPSSSAEHALGHGAREVYLEEALRFWARP